MFNQQFFMSVVAPYINFFLFLFLAYKLFKNPLDVLLQRQKDEFLKTANEAHEALEKAKEKEKLLKVRISNLEASLQEISAKEKADVENEAYAVIKNAESLAKHLREEAERIAEAEIRKARETLKEEIMELVKSGVIKKIETELTENDQKNVLKKDLELLSRSKVEI